MQNNTSSITQSLVGQGASKLAQGKTVAIPEEAVNTVNQLFLQLRAIFPAWKNSFPDEASYREAKRLWLETLVSEGIITINQLQRGLALAKKSNKPFWPSVGEFVSWCLTEDYQALGLPDKTELLSRLRAFQGYGMEYVHAFKFRSPAEYWLITDLYVRCKTGEWREKQLVEEADKALAKMVKRIKQGEQIPEPAITLPDKVERKLSRAELEKRWADLRKQVGI